MSCDLAKKAEESYLLAEKRAFIYYKELFEILEGEEYLESLNRDIESFKIKHFKKGKFYRFLEDKEKNLSENNYKGYIKYLDYKGKLESYLERSISYIYMRDLGKNLKDEESRTTINDTIESLMKHFKSKDFNEEQEKNFSMDLVYKKAKEEGIELTLIWLINKIKDVSHNIPKEIDNNQAVRKLIKIIAGVIIYSVEGFPKDITKEEKTKKLDEAIRIGYAYGLTYPFIDDLFDCKILGEKEEKLYSKLIEDTLITGIVPKLENNEGKNRELINFIHGELKEGFEYIKNHQEEENVDSFLKLSYIFFNSQEVDRKKSLDKKDYKNEEIYVPIILKSAASRLIVGSVINMSKDKTVAKNLFIYGIYNQLADDFTDIFEDYKRGDFTPYTYYFKYYRERTDLINPFELYWTVIFYIIHKLYQSDRKTAEVILSRAINSLKRFKAKLGAEKYKKHRDIFKVKNEKFNNLIESLVENSMNVDFFDKLLRDFMIENLKKERENQNKFSNEVKEIQRFINKNLKLRDEDNKNLNSELIESSNYSLDSGGKRLRPVIAYFMAKKYNIDSEKIKPLLKSIEYMHTASLIIDDLPSQDNASLRRGRETVHKRYDVATAELASLYLIEEAILEQSNLEFKKENVLKVIRYSTKAIKEMCRGQLMDLRGREKILDIEELKTICFYKTGIAFEASLVMVALLANESEEEIKKLKNFAYYAGIAFQIKDDILDGTGDEKTLGKDSMKDVKNKNATFLTILGEEEAERQLLEYYCLAMDSLKLIKGDVEFLKQMMNYILNRNK